MTVTELKEKLEKICNNGGGDCDVVINVINPIPSFGVRMYVGIDDVRRGFDWEHAQVRITPTEKLGVVKR